MRPAEVCGCWTKPSSSSRARMFRTVADDTPSPAAVTNNDEATGSPEEIYSRTSAASSRLERSAVSGVITLTVRLKPDTTYCLVSQVPLKLDTTHYLAGSGSCVTAYRSLGV